MKKVIHFTPVVMFAEPFLKSLCIFVLVIHHEYGASHSRIVKPRNIIALNNTWNVIFKSVLIQWSNIRTDIFFSHYLNVSRLYGHCSRRDQWKITHNSVRTHAICKPWHGGRLSLWILQQLFLCYTCQHGEEAYILGHG